MANYSTQPHGTYMIRYCDHSFIFFFYNNIKVELIRMGKNSFWIIFFFSIPGSAPTFRGSFLSKLTMSSLGPIPSKNCYNFSVCLSISLFLVSKNHGRRQQPFEAKNKQKLPRVRKLFAFKDQKRVEKRLKTVIVPSPELQLCRELWVAACPRPATQSSP